jgi:hypothetical protein
MRARLDLAHAIKIDDSATMNAREAVPVQLFGEIRSAIRIKNEVLRACSVAYSPVELIQSISSAFITWMRGRKLCPLMSPIAVRN